jgi:TetR/AcrR family transcriptional regulator, transcriptional repressor of bet genes
MYWKEMPKQVDHERRRADIAAAVWRLTVEEGLTAVSMRRVADLAGVSLGQVQHYFTSKDDLLMVAVELIGEQFTRRYTAAHPADSTPLTRARAFLTQMLPLDEERIVEAHVGSAFLAYATHSPRIAEFLRGGFGWAADLLVGCIEDGRRVGQVAAVRDPRREARTLLALVDGLAAHTLVGHHTPAEAEEALDAHLAELFGQVGDGERIG